MLSYYLLVMIVIFKQNKGIKMKKIFSLIIPVILLFLSSCYTTQNVSDQNSPKGTFSQLDGYGQWMNIQDLGTVWQPNVSADWQPYSDGHWVWTANGWMWDSYEPFGWVVYHYGYWDNDPQYGWIWIPSYQWTPANVNWYNQNGYVGWSPQPSPGFIHSHLYSDSPNYWVVVPQQNFIDNNVSRFRTRDNAAIANIRNNEGSRSPDIRTIENVTNQRITVNNIVNEKIKSGGRELVRARVVDDRNTNPSNNNINNQRNANEVKRSINPNNVTRPVEPTPIRIQTPPANNYPNRNSVDNQNRVINNQRNAVDNRVQRPIIQNNKPKIKNQNRSKINKNSSKINKNSKPIKKVTLPDKKELVK